MRQLLSLQAPPVLRPRVSSPHTGSPPCASPLPAHLAARVGTHPSKMVTSQGCSAKVIKATATPGPDPHLSSGKGAGRGNQGLFKATRGPRGGDRDCRCQTYTRAPPLLRIGVDRGARAAQAKTDYPALRAVGPADPQQGPQGSHVSAATGPLLRACGPARAPVPSSYTRLATRGGKGRGAPARSRNPAPAGRSESLTDPDGAPAAPTSRRRRALARPAINPSPGAVGSPTPTRADGPPPGLEARSPPGTSTPPRSRGRRGSKAGSEAQGHQAGGGRQGDSGPPASNSPRGRNGPAGSRRPPGPAAGAPPPSVPRTRRSGRKCHLFNPFPPAASGLTR